MSQQAPTLSMSFAMPPAQFDAQVAAEQTKSNATAGQLRANERLQTDPEMLALGAELEAAGKEHTGAIIAVEAAEEDVLQARKALAAVERAAAAAASPGRQTTATNERAINEAKATLKDAERALAKARAALSGAERTVEKSRAKVDHRAHEVQSKSQRT